MKILLLADIHANSAALAALRETFDVCLFVGDVVEYGVDPVPCIEWVRDHAAYAVRGNHDHAVSQRVAPSNGSGFRRLASATRLQHWSVLEPQHLKYLSRLPVTQQVELDGKSFFLVHATPRDPLDEYLADDLAAWEQRLKGIDADFVCVGHTHVPMHLHLGRTQVINPGSLGQPRDGDPRAAYAVIENGQLDFRRVEYYIDASVAQLRASGIDEASLEVAIEFLRTGGKTEE
jgi:putative phosphoesterase